MKTFDQVSHAIHYAKKTGGVGVTVIDYGFTIFGALPFRPAGEFFVCYPNGEITVAEYFEIR